MLDSIIVVGLVALIITILQETIEYFKSTVGKMVLQIVMFILVGMFNVANGAVFNEAVLTWSAGVGYFRDGLILGAAASGIYGIGKSIVNTTTEYRAKKRKIQ